jgi:hypothetical protein
MTRIFLDDALPVKLSGTDTKATPADLSTDTAWFGPAPSIARMSEGLSPSTPSGES